MEEIHELQQAQRRAGSTLLRTLTASKRRHRQQQRSDCSHRQGMDELMEESTATDTETTVTAITQWLTWITEVERHQPLWQQLEHPNEQYHRHLEDTYLVQLQQHPAMKATTDDDRGSDHDMYMSDTGPTLVESDLNIRERAGPTLADQQDQHANTPDETI